MVTWTKMTLKMFKSLAGLVYRLFVYFGPVFQPCHKINHCVWFSISKIHTTNPAGVAEWSKKLVPIQVAISPLQNQI